MSVSSDVASLPKLRSGERVDFKRCTKKWFWTWRMGLVPKALRFGALELGTWWHAGLAAWYGKGTKRNGSLKQHVADAAMEAVVSAGAEGAPDYMLNKAAELSSLAVEMAAAYERQYGNDSDVHVLETELPLEFTIADPDTDTLIATHKLKPDLIYTDVRQGGVWLKEHKTAQTIRTEHLVIDDQARPYGVFAERALMKLGVIRPGQFKGIMYNFTRKTLPDLRPMNADGKYLNKDGSISKKQPSPQFLRHPVRLTRAAKKHTLYRLLGEAIMITRVTDALRARHIRSSDLPKTPHYSCPKTCNFFSICVEEENGNDIRGMIDAMFVKRDPYEYEEETSDDRPSFEMG